MSDDKQQPLWVRALLDMSVSLAAYRIFAYLSWRQGSNGDSWPSQGVIAADLHLTQRTVRTATKRLEDRGYIRIHRPKDQGRGIPLRYSVVSQQKGGNKSTPLMEKGGNERPPLAQERRKLTTSKGGNERPTNTYHRTHTKKNNDPHQQIFDHWNSFKGSSITKDGEKITWHSHQLRPDGAMAPEIRKAIKAALAEGHTVEEIKQGISNYAKVLLGQDFYWTYVWPLTFFLTRGTEKHKNAPRQWLRFKSDSFIEDHYLTAAAKQRRANTQRGPSVYRLIKSGNEQQETTRAETA